jgi:hypothetical protein
MSQCTTRHLDGEGKEVCMQNWLNNHEKIRVQRRLQIIRRGHETHRDTAHVASVIADHAHPFWIESTSSGKWRRRRGSGDDYCTAGDREDGDCSMNHTDADRQRCASHIEDAARVG